MENIPLMDLSTLAEDIHTKTRQASQNTNLDMPKFLGMDKILQTMEDELRNSASKLTGINERIKNDNNKLKEV